MSRFALIICVLIIFAQKANLACFAFASNDPAITVSSQIDESKSDDAQSLPSDFAETFGGEDASEDSELLFVGLALVFSSSSKIYFTPKVGFPLSPVRALIIPPNTAQG
jgi:hypothetical protein